MATVSHVCPADGHPVGHRGSVNEATGTAFESPPKIGDNAMKYGVFANLITGKTLYSAHRKKACAEKACAKASKGGACFVVLPIKK